MILIKEKNVRIYLDKILKILVIDNINKVVRDIYLQIDDIKYNYNLSDEDINKFSILNKNLEKLIKIIKY